MNLNNELIRESKKFPILKRFKLHGNSHEVVLLQAPDKSKIIRKQYNSKNPAHVASFSKEIKILTDLEKRQFPFVPRLLAIDHKNLTFFQTYVGKTPPNSKKYHKKAKKRTKELYKQHGYRYIHEGKKIWKTYWGNYCINKGEIYLIDFGSLKWTMPHTKPEKIAMKKKKKS